MSDQKRNRTWRDVAYNLVEWVGLVCVILILAKCHSGSL